MADATQIMKIDSPLNFRRGGRLPEFTIAFETWGKLIGDGENAILLFTGLSPSAHATSSKSNPEPGWWEPMVGPGRPIDTNRFHVICINSLGSCFGSTGPASMNPATGQRWGMNFPPLSIEDIAVAAKMMTDELGLKAIVVVPSFSNDDFLASRFPALGEGEFLDHVLDELRGEYRLRPKILLTGYSRGGQFSHRFALQNPEKVEACAPFAAGTWTTPDGRLLIDRFGEVSEPESFLSTSENATDVPERLRNLFQPRVAAVAGLAADPASKAIPFLVMNGTLDPRLPIAREFARSLAENGYSVETDWPRTPHVCDDEPACRVEFGRYAQRAVEFFLSVTSMRAGSAKN